MDTKKERAEAFSRKMCDILNLGALNLAVGIGYEAGIFEAMAEMESPATCGEIAEQAGVDARYLYEWLGVMVAGEVIDGGSDGTDDEVFILPREHVPFLCRSGGNSNMGVYAQEIPLLTLCAKDGVLGGMKTGEGLPYSAYPKFYDFMEQLADAKHREVLVGVFLPSVLDGEMVGRLREGINVCDIGCAGGVALELMAEAFPRSLFTGIDISEESIRAARRRVASRGLENISFKVMDAARSTVEAERYDYITAFDSIHDQTKPFEALKNIHTMLKPSGVFSMIDIAARSSLTDNTAHPMGAFLYTVSLMHCMPVGLHERGAGVGMMWGQERAVQMCRDAGFRSVSVEDIPQDGFNYHYLCLK